MYALIWFAWVVGTAAPTPPVNVLAYNSLKACNEARVKFQRFNTDSVTVQQPDGKWKATPVYSFRKCVPVFMEP